MTPEQARERFSDALERELSVQEQAEFDAALAADAGLAAEYRRFAEMMDATRALSRSTPPTPNLLPKIQARIRKRSRGRYYRDRFAEKGHQNMIPVLAGAVMLLILAAAWWMAQFL